MVSFIKASKDILTRNIDKNNLTFHLNKERKIQFLLNLLNSENIKYSIQNKNDGYKTFRIGLSTDNVLFNYIGIFKKIYNILILHCSIL